MRDVARSTESDLQILEKVIIVGGPGVLAVQSGVGGHSLGVGVGRGRHVLVRNTAILNAEWLHFETDVFDGAGGGEGKEARDHETAQTGPREKAPATRLMPSHCVFF